MFPNSGIKAIDQLIKKHGVHYGDADNAFQRTLYLPPCESVMSTRAAILPFGLHRFPPSIWLKLTTECQQRPTVLHQFRLPQLDGKRICWVLMDTHGQVLELAVCINKIHYVKAAKYLTSLLIYHADSPQHVELAYG
ncbi:hypothetical protein [Neptunicella sp. SCSIO 80796]|uniref:hypothetical protein n=1 Tax=Neptunicella plasticusilytica TaxID=3117012 RepID=UPI003A4DE5A0